MQLVGYSFVRATGPVRVAHVPLGDLTVIFGPNDAGKSRLLATMVGHLSGRRVEDRVGSESAAFFARLAEDEMSIAVHSADAAHGEDDAGNEEEDEEVGDGEEPAAGLLGDLLAQNRLIALEPRFSGGPTEELDAHWCIPSLELLPDELRLEAEKRLPGIGSTRELDLRIRDGSVARKLWRSVPGSPVPVTDVGTELFPVLPVPLSLPVSSDSLVAEAVAALTGLTSFLDAFDSIAEQYRGLHDLDAEARSLFAHHLTLETGSRQLALQDWLEHGDARSVSFRPDVLIGCDLLQTTAARLLPSFVADSYEIVVEPRLPDWRDLPPLTFQLRRKSDGAEFPVSCAADGFSIWLQLALLEGVDALRLREARLWAHMTEFMNADLEFVEPDDEEADAQVSRALESFRAEVASFRNADPLPRDAREDKTIFLRDWKALEKQGVAERVRGLRPRFYVIDEPERHLHPRLQRIAARWLADTVRERRSQCIVSSHSVPFLSLGPDTRFLYVRPVDGGTSFVGPFDPEQVTALAEIAAEMGLNRGELLSNVVLLVFVEGRADQKVFEALFLKRFHRSGIAVVPLGGAIHAKQIVDSELLLRYTTAKAAAALDDLALEELQRLKTDEEFLQESLRSRKLTLSAMANLVMNARTYGREVEPFGYPKQDIFDLLDEDILKETYPDFPGHDKARTEWRQSRRDGEGWKDFYLRQYGIPQGIGELYVPVADVMQERGRIPPELEELADELERYALTD